MRKRDGRLTLHRETLHRLDQVALRKVLGGTNGGTFEIETTCACTIGCQTNCCGTGGCGGGGGGTFEIETTCVC